MYTTNAISPYPNSSIFGYNNYSSNLYDNTKDISSAGDYSRELQVCHGYFQTIASAGADGYRDYTGYYANGRGQPNYSSISSSEYRYATFCWKIQPGLPITNGKIMINIAGISGIMVQRVGPTISNAVVSNDNDKTPIYVYCRFQDLSSGIPYPKDNQHFSSVWIDLNSNVDSQHEQNYCLSTIYFRDVDTNGEPNIQPNYIIAGLGADISWNLNNTTLQYNTNTTSIITSGSIPTEGSGNCYFYVTIGLPMNKPISFQYVQAKFF
jgi:hypothetical protein